MGWPRGHVAPMRGLSTLFVGAVFLLLAVGFTWLGWQSYRTERGLKERATVATATIASFEGSFWTGRRAKVENFNYWVEYDGYRYHFQWRERYRVGERIRLVYDRGRPSIARILNDGQTGLEDPVVDWRFSAMALAFALFGGFSIRSGNRSLTSVD